MRSLTISVVLTLLIVLPIRGDTTYWADSANIRLTIAAPESRFIRVRQRHGVRTYHYINRSGLLSTTQWPLIFRMESRSAVGFVARKVQNQEREGWVITDPDECVHVGSLLDDLVPPVFDASCPFEDETHVEVQTEKFDTFGEFDNDTTGNDAIRARLIDDKSSDSAPRNTPYLRMFDGKSKPVGPKTGGRPVEGVSKPDELDGFGYGADDDLASFVLIADVGGARVFDEEFDLMPGVIRNMAGFLNTVSAEDLDGRGQTAITASMHLLAGVFEPIAIVDADVSDPALDGFDYAMRVDSGPVFGVNLLEPFPPSAPGAANAFYDELLTQYYPADITVRAVLVNGEAPDFIHDMDGNGRYTAKDVELAGFQLLSNEVKINLTLTHVNLLTESSDSKCPPRTFVHGDLDGNQQRGMLPDCIGTSGASRLRRRPR